MTRSAAKNHPFVTVVVDVEDYKAVLDEMAANKGATTLALRRTLAQRAFARTAAYDAAVSGWFAEELAKDGVSEPPRRRAFGGLLRQSLRYGENPHQQAAFYADGSSRPGVASARNCRARNCPTTTSTTPTPPMNWWRSSIRKPGPALRHHQARQSLWRGAGQKPERGLSGGAGLRSTKRLWRRPGLQPDAGRRHRRGNLENLHRSDHCAERRCGRAEILASKKNLRLLVAGGLPDPLTPTLTYRSVAGGFLVQTRDNGRVTRAELKVVTKRRPTEQEITDMLLAFTIGQAREVQRHHLCEGWIDPRASARGRCPAWIPRASPL